MKKFIKIFIVITLIFSIIFLFLNKYFFKTDQDRLPILTELKESNFEIVAAKPFYYSIDNDLYFSPDGKSSSQATPIWRGRIEKAYISPDSKYALLYANNKLTLIDFKGAEITHLNNCTGLYTVQEDRRSGRFLSDEIQWDETSGYFLISQDRVWDKNFSKENKSTIYKYNITERTLKPLINLNEELAGCILFGANASELYYEFATAKGDLAIKKVNLTTGKILSEHFQGEKLRLTNINSDSVFFNYVNFNENEFDCNSYDLKSLITPAGRGDTIGLYLKNADTVVKLMAGLRGINAFKGLSYDFFQNGYFLPGNVFFIANVSAKNYEGQIVINTKTYALMKLNYRAQFYFNINSKDCKDFVFRYKVGPNFKYSTSARLSIEGINTD